MSLERALVGASSHTVNSAVGTCSYGKVWLCEHAHLCVFLYYCFIVSSTQSCKQLTEDALKISHIESQGVFFSCNVMVHVWWCTKCNMLCACVCTCLFRLRCSVSIHAWWRAVHHRCTAVQPHRPGCYLSSKWRQQHCHLTDIKRRTGEPFPVWCLGVPLFNSIRCIFAEMSIISLSEKIILHDSVHILS